MRCGKLEKEKGRFRLMVMPFTVREDAEHFRFGCLIWYI